MNPRILRLAERDPHTLRVKRPEQLRGESFVREGRLDPRCHQRAWGLEVALADVGDEDGEQRACVREQLALPAVEPQEVRVPVVVARRIVDEDEVALAQEREQAGRAAQEHTRRYRPARLGNSVPRASIEASI